MDSESDIASASDNELTSSDDTDDSAASSSSSSSVSVYGSSSGGSSSDTISEENIQLQSKSKYPSFIQTKSHMRLKTRLLMKLMRKFLWYKSYNYLQFFVFI